MNAMAAPAMITRPIPSSGEAMPVIGLGTWQAFDVGNNAAAHMPLKEVLTRFTGAGARLIDTSPMYGSAETVVGDLVAEMGLRPRIFLATKVWTSGKEAGIAQMRRSAERLKSPVLDLIQIHNLLDWRTHLATLRDMKANGQVRYIGITHYTTGSLPELARILETEPGIDFVQFGYSLATRDAETKLLPVAASRRVATIVNQPFETGDMGRGVRLRELGAAVPEIHSRGAGGDGGHSGDRGPGAYGGRSQSRFRPPARCAAAAKDPPALGQPLGTVEHGICARYAGSPINVTKKQSGGRKWSTRASSPIDRRECPSTAALCPCWAESGSFSKTFGRSCGRCGSASWSGSRSAH